MSSADEECLPDLLASNTSIIKLGIDVRSQLVKMKLERIIAENRDQMRQMRNAENKKNTSSKEGKKKLLKGLSFKPKSKSVKAWIKEPYLRVFLYQNGMVWDLG